VLTDTGTIGMAEDFAWEHADMDHGGRIVSYRVSDADAALVLTSRAVLHR